MKYVMLKTLRDIRDTLGSFISIVVVIVIGCLFFSGITAASAAVTNQVKDYYASSNYATRRAEYMYVNAPAVDQIAESDGVKRAAGYNTFRSQTHIGRGTYGLTVTTLTPGIDDPYIISGRMPERGEILIDQVTAERHGVKAGDAMTFSVATASKITLSLSSQGAGEADTPQYGVERTDIDYAFTVSGIYHDPDVIYKVDVNNTAAQPHEIVFGRINVGDIALFTPDAVIMYGETTVLRLAELKVDVFGGIKIIGGRTAEKLFDRYTLSTAEEIMQMFMHTERPAGLFMYELERKNFPAVASFDGVNDTIAALAAVLPFIFFAVAAAITVISLSKTVDNQRMQIGIIQALGVSKGAVYFSYIFYALFACLIGGIVGGIVGVVLIPYLLNFLYARQFCMPPVPQHVSLLFLFLGIIVAAALACTAAFLSCHRTLKVNPAQAMRPKPPKKSKRILVERWTWLWSRLGFGAKMNMRNMFLHKLRMLLSSVGIIGCLALLIALIGLKDNMDSSFDGYDRSAGYDITAVIVAPLDLGEFDLDEISDKKGAEYVEHLTFAPDFSGRITLGNRAADMIVMAIPSATEAADYEYADADCVTVYTDLFGRRRVNFDGDTFAIPTGLAEKLGAKVGDTVHVSGYALDNHAVSFDVKITHIVYEYFEQKAYCSYGVFQKNNVGLYADTAYVSVKDGVDINHAAKTLKDYEEVHDVRTFAETYSALKDKMAMLDYAVILFVIGAAVLAVAVIYNITATNLKERTREIATLMVLGYKSYETAGMIIVENMVITVLGCLLGLPLGYGLMLYLVNISTSFNVFISSFLSWYVSIGCMALTFLFSLAATLLFNKRIKNISMVEALKSVE